MKKVLAFALGTIMMVSLVACGKIPGTSDLENSLNQLLGEVSSLVEESGDLSSLLGDLTGENNGGVTGPASMEDIDGDPTQYSQSYWEEKYPDYNFCPFYIEENGVAKNYYWPMGYEGLDGTMATWITCPFNWNGWHMTPDGCIVNEKETLKLTDNWTNGESMSSCCTVTTEKYKGDGGYADGGSADLGSVAGADNFAGYKLNLPKDNFSVTYKVFSYGLTFGAFDKKTGNVFITGDGDVGYSEKYDFNEGKVTGAEFGSDEWGWRDDDIANYSYNDFVATKLASFDDIFMYVFYAYGKENSQLKDYCVGVEEVAGHYCWVFDAQGLNAMTEKYWVDIESGLCMKMLDSYGDGFEVVELNTAYYGE